MACRPKGRPQKGFCQTEIPASLAGATVKISRRDLNSKRSYRGMCTCSTTKRGSRPWLSLTCSQLAQCPAWWTTSIVRSLKLTLECVSRRRAGTVYTRRSPSTHASNLSLLASIPKWIWVLTVTPCIKPTRFSSNNLTPPSKAWTRSSLILAVRHSFRSYRCSTKQSWKPLHRWRVARRLQGLAQRDSLPLSWPSSLCLRQRCQPSRQRSRRIHNHPQTGSHRRFL